MKIVKIIIQYCLAIILGLSILAIILVNIASSNILNKNYVISKMKEANYYEKILEQVKSNFENYIYQSGLDENVLNNLVSLEKIEKDTNSIINNIYDGTEDKVNTDVISEKLDENIKNSISVSLYNSQKKSIESFIETICKEYETTIISTKYTEKANNVYKTAKKYINLIKKVSLILIAICCVFILILSIKKIYEFFAITGVSFEIAGIIITIIKFYILKKVNINGISILGEHISEVLRNILIDLFNKIGKYGFTCITLGIILIVLYGVIKGIVEYSKEKEKYNPED